MSEIRELGARAKAASRVLMTASAERKNRALEAAAESLRHAESEILKANALDVERARGEGMGEAFIDRLTLTSGRIGAIAEGLLEVAALPDPVGELLERKRLSSGIELEKISVPIGVIAVIFESRPNVAADSAALCLKSGNAV
ncbi:MAG: gamma-glutamyl-phosphate reductase, partial [Oscillospiraceae bacterium]|nr:gamma-glutamyl-phosphate reductase [Oscillospiraceae bacterium]